MIEPHLHIACTPRGGLLRCAAFWGAHEWLLYRDDPARASETDALRARDLPLRAVNLRPKKFDRLAAATPQWTYSTPGADLHVVTFLALRWTLDYALH